MIYLAVSLVAFASENDRFFNGGHQWCRLPSTLIINGSLDRKPTAN